MEDIETTHFISSGDGANNPSSIPIIEVDERYRFPELDILENLGDEVFNRLDKHLKTLPDDDASRKFLEKIVDDERFGHDLSDSTERIED